MKYNNNITVNGTTNYNVKVDNTNLSFEEMTERAKKTNGFLVYKRVYNNIDGQCYGVTARKTEIWTDVNGNVNIWTGCKTPTYKAYNATGKEVHITDCGSLSNAFMAIGMVYGEHDFTPIEHEPLADNEIYVTIGSVKNAVRDIETTALESVTA